MRFLLSLFSIIMFSGLLHSENNITSLIDSIVFNSANYEEAVGSLRNINDDDLLRYIEVTQDELAKCKAYNALCWRNFMSNPNQAFEYAQKQLSIAEKINNNEALIISYDNLAWLYSGFNDNDKAIKFMLKSLEAKEINGDKKGMATGLAGLAKTYYNMKNYKLSLKHLKEAIVIEESLNDATVEGLRRRAALHGNIAQCNVELGNINTSIENFDKAIKLYKQAGLEESDAGIVYTNIGLVYFKHRKNLDKALKYLFKAIEILEKKGDVSALSNVYSSVSEVYSEKYDFTNALIFGKKAVNQASLSNDKGDILAANKSLAIAFYKSGNYKLAYEYFQVAFDLKDTIFNAQSAEQIAEMQTKYDTEKKEAENKLLKTEKELDKAEIKRKSSQQKMLLIGLFATVLFGTYIAFSLIQKKKTNRLLNEQNEQISTKNKIIEEKNKDITDSINYAKRIQNAILPGEKALAGSFESFILYKPKDIVSGDFYWVKEVGDKVFFSVVDCTGHGVPGAFMSIIGFNSLNRIVDDLGITNSGIILDTLNDLVIDSIAKEAEDGIAIRDGMDMSFCCFDKKSKTLEYSGAQNSIYLVRQNSKNLSGIEPLLQENGYSFYEIKADKMAIGGSQNNDKYKSHNIELQKNDTIYLFSDGYADQFGGPKGKKFMYKRFKELILSIQQLPMESQLKSLDNTIIEWMGELEQLDDICVMGIRV